jgi:hypothetical protein
VTYPIKNMFGRKEGDEMRQKFRSVLLFGSVAVLSIVFLNLVACKKQIIPASEPEDPTSLETSKILRDSLAEQILQTMFTPEKDIAANGAVGPNRKGYHNIRPQADGSFLALASGIARSDDVLIERGVRALEFGLPHQNPDGTFEGSSEQDIARFGYFGLRAYNLLAHSTYAQQYSTRLETIFEALLGTEKYILEILPQHPEIFETTNQVAMLAYTLTIAGQKAENEALIAKGDSLLQWVLAVQREDGVFPELDGHDSHYQAVSLMALANLYLYSTEPVHQQTIYPALLAGLQWEKTHISSSGYINDEGNTRTANDPEDSPEGKQINPREIALTLLHLSYLGSEFSEARNLSEIVLADLLERWH